MLEREREIAGMEAAHQAALALLEEQLLNAESRLARESEQCRSLEQRCVFLRDSLYEAMKDLQQLLAMQCMETSRRSVQKGVQRALQQAVVSELAKVAR